MFLTILANKKCFHCCNLVIETSCAESFSEKKLGENCWTFFGSMNFSWEIMMISYKLSSVSQLAREWRHNSCDPFSDFRDRQRHLLRVRRKLQMQNDCSVSFDCAAEGETVKWTWGPYPVLHKFQILNLNLVPRTSKHRFDSVFNLLVTRLIPKGS